MKRNDTPCALRRLRDLEMLPMGRESPLPVVEWCQMRGFSIAGTV